MSGNGRHRRPRQVPAIVVAAGVTGSAIAIPLLASASANAADASTWDKVAACESGGNWSANLSNGYFGGLQISQDSWNEFGGSRYADRPDEASRSQQIAIAEKILEGQGSQTWSGCAESAGLPKAAPASGSGGDSDGGSLGDALNGLLGGSQHSGSSDGSDGSGASDGTSGSGDSGITDPSGTPSPSATEPSAEPGATGGSDDSLLPGDLTSPGSTATGSPAPSDSASPNSSATGGKHRATGHGSQDSSAGGDGGFPSGVSQDNSGGVAPASPTGGAGSIGNGDLPGVVRATGGAPVIHIPFAPGDSGARAASPSPWRLPDEAVTPSAVHGAPGSVGPSGASAGTPGVTDPSSAVTGGKHRGAAEDHAVTPKAPNESGKESQTGRSGRSAASDDSSSHGAASPAGSAARYVVRAGDSLSGIASSERVDGGWHALFEANKAALGSDPNHIVPGQTLQLGDV